MAAKSTAERQTSLHRFLVVVCSMVCFRCAGSHSLGVANHSFGRAAKSKIVGMARILIMRSQVVTDLMRGRKKKFRLAADVGSHRAREFSESYLAQRVMSIS